MSHGSASPRHLEPASRAGPAQRMERVSKRATCTSPWIFPSANTTFDASSTSGPLDFTWDPKCMTLNKATLTLYAPSLDRTIIKQYTDISYSSGSYPVTLLPKWWNSTTSIQLYATLSDPNAIMSFLSDIPAGPTFTVTWPASQLVQTVAGGSTVAAPPADTALPDPVSVAAYGDAKSGLPAGSVFAAVFFPIAIAIIAVVFYVRYTRAKQASKRQRWSTAIDQRMSRISGDWTPGLVGPNGSNRRSMASSNRRSTFHEGGENRAGMGANRPSLFITDADASSQPEMSHTSFARPQLASLHNADGQRKSVTRVSFAHAATPNSRVSFVDPDAPKTPIRSATSIYANQNGSQSTFGRPSISIHGPSGLRMGDDDIISPTQELGPHVIGDDEVSKMGSQEELDDFSDMAAVRMMQVNTSGGTLIQQAALASTTTSTQPTRPILAPSVSSFFDSPAPSAAADVSPDDMLKAYAAQKAASTSRANGGPSALALPPPGSQDAATRRTTLTPGTPVTPGQHNPFRQSMVSDSSRYSAHGGEGVAK